MKKLVHVKRCTLAKMTASAKKPAVVKSPANRPLGKIELHRRIRLLIIDRVRSLKLSKN